VICSGDPPSESTVHMCQLPSGDCESYAIRRPSRFGNRPCAKGSDRITGTADDLDWSDKPVAPPRHGLDELRSLRGIAERVAKTFDGGVQTVFEIDEGIGGCPCRFWRSPALRRSPAITSNSNVPNRIRWGSETAAFITVRFSPRRPSSGAGS
jgi:hypothetical protein